MSAWTAGRPLVRPARVVGLASVLVDVAVRLPGLPLRGGDVVAADAGLAAGGGINALAAAARLGLPAAYAGPHGSGPNGDAVRAALAADGIAALLPPDPAADTGWCLAMLEPDGERTFVTVPGAEARQRREPLAAVGLRADDAVYVSGYDLAYPDAGPAVAAFVAGLPAAADGGPLVVLDPGPLVGEIPGRLVLDVLDRTDLLTLSRTEAASMGVGDGLRCPGMPDDAAVVVRAGADGAVVRCPGVQPHRQPGVAPPGPVVDTNGAGDVHTGALLAGLGRGLDLPGAVRLANTAAAWSVTRPGASSGPTTSDLAPAGPALGD